MNSHDQAIKSDHEIGFVYPQDTTFIWIGQEESSTIRLRLWLFG